MVAIQKDEPIFKSSPNDERAWILQIPVFNKKQSVGSISEKTILREILAGKDITQISKLPVESVMEEAFPQVGRRRSVVIDFKSSSNISGNSGFQKRQCYGHNNKGRPIKNGLMQCFR